MRKPNFLQIKQLIKPHIVAIISLLTALSGLYYNSWRDHQNEINQNHRDAAFEVLKNLGELQSIVNYAHYQTDNERGNPIEGWKHVLLVRDLSHLLPHSNMQQGEQLYLAWQQHWEHLQTNSTSEQHISNRIASARTDVLHTIATLR